MNARPRRSRLATAVLAATTLLSASATARTESAWLAAQPRAAASSEAPDAATRDIRHFRPSAHGFAFVNRFEGPAVHLGGISALIPGPGSYGLCGGMAFTAADAYLANAPLPDRTDAPRRGSRDHRWIYRRQASSLGWGGWNALRIARWSVLPDPAADAANADQLAAIRDRLARGEPVPLCLIYRPAWETAALWQNHQVLAYALADTDTNAKADADRPIDVRVYDSNYPHHDGIVIRFEPTPDGFTASRIVPGRGTRPVRAVLALPYTPRPVPPGL